MTEFKAQAGPAERAMPEQVFHYTSLETMTRIVDSRALWCTAIPYLNDSEERSFLLQAVKDRLPRLKKKDDSIDPALSLRTSGRDGVSYLTSFAEEQFVACFAENGDSLMHWRAYCPQKNGIAIGFRTACLRHARLAEKPLPGMLTPSISFDPVGYVDTRDKETIDKVIYAAYEEAKRYAADEEDGSRVVPPETRADSLNAHFEWALKAIACGNKQKAFEVEDEFRLLVHSMRFRENNIKFRTVTSTMIPYVIMAIPSLSERGPDYDFGNEKKFPWNAIQSVMIGPTPNMDLTQRSVEAFFALLGMRIQVSESEIPYRDW
jgi:hypothetical protein